MLAEGQDKMSYNGGQGMSMQWLRGTMLISMPSSESGLLPVKAERILLLLWR